MIKILVVGYWAYEGSFRVVEKRADIRGKNPEFLVISEARLNDLDEVSYMQVPWKRVNHDKRTIVDQPFGQLSCPSMRYLVNRRIRLFVDVEEAALSSYEAFSTAVNSEIKKREAKFLANKDLPF